MFNKVYSSDFFKRKEWGNIPSNIHDYRWTDYKAIERRCMEVNAQIKAKENKKYNSMSVPRSQFNPAGPCPATVEDQFLVPPCRCPKHRGVGYMGGRDCACVADRPPEGSWDPKYESQQNDLSMLQGGYHTPGYSYTAGQGDGLHTRSHPGAYQPPAYCPPIGIDPRCLVRPRNKTMDNSRRPTGAPYFAQESKPSCTESQEAPTLKLGTFTFEDWLETEHQRQPPASLRGGCISVQNNCCRSRNVNCYPTAYTLVPYQTGYCY